MQREHLVLHPLTPAMSDGGLFPRGRARRLLKSVRKGGGSEFKWKDWLVPGGIVAVALACVVLVYAFYPGRSGPAMVLRL